MASDDVVVLLGAGASFDAGLPLAGQMTSKALALLGRDWTRDGRRLKALLALVVDRLTSSAGDGFAAGIPDIERVVSTVEMLQDRTQFELAPFVTQWDPTLSAVAVDDDDRHVLATLRRDGLAELHAAGDRTLLDHANGVEQLRVSGELESWRFNQLLQRLYQLLLDMLALPASTNLDYLAPLVELGAQAGGLTIATLNYDLTVECAAKDRGVALSTGVEGWEASGVVDLPDSGVRLLKLHGSLDWVRGTEVPTRGFPGVPKTRLELRPAEADDVPFLIFGRREKLRPQGPFLALRAEFARRLNAARCLVVVGYSFADDHVNEMIAHWVNARHDRSIVVVDPGFPVSLTQAVGFTRLLYGGLSQPPLLGPNRPGGRLWVLREGAASALPTVAQRSASDLLRGVEQRV